MANRPSSWKQTLIACWVGIPSVCQIDWAVRMPGVAASSSQPGPGSHRSDAHLPSTIVRIWIGSSMHHPLALTLGAASGQTPALVHSLPRLTSGPLGSQRREPDEAGPRATYMVYLDDSV